MKCRLKSMFALISRSAVPCELWDVAVQSLKRNKKYENNTQSPKRHSERRYSQDNSSHTQIPLETPLNPTHYLPLDFATWKKNPVIEPSVKYCITFGKITEMIVIKMLCLSVETMRKVQLRRVPLEGATVALREVTGEDVH